MVPDTKDYTKSSRASSLATPKTLAGRGEVINGRIGLTDIRSAEMDFSTSSVRIRKGFLSVSDCWKAITRLGLFGEPFLLRMEGIDFFDFLGRGMK